jgi:Skp family chaperone for outer membrane proteins
MKKIILSSLVVLGLSTAAFAQAAAPDFATVDADASGGVSLAEAQVVLPDLTEEAFTAADIDANGELSAEEFATLAAPAAPAS